MDIFDSRLALYTKLPGGRCLTYVGREGNVDYIAGYNAYVVDGIQISRMYWSGPNFYLRIPAVTGIDVVGSPTANVRLSVLQFDPRARRVRFQISLPSALQVRFDVYDVAGRRLRKLLDRQLPEGETVVEWDRSSTDGTTAHTGVYFGRMTYESGSRVVRLPYIR